MSKKTFVIKFEAGKEIHDSADDIINMFVIRILQTHLEDNPEAQMSLEVPDFLKKFIASKLAMNSYANVFSVDIDFQNDILDEMKI